MLLLLLLLLALMCIALLLLLVLLYVSPSELSWLSTTFKTFVTSSSVKILYTTCLAMNCSIKKPMTSACKLTSQSINRTCGKQAQCLSGIPTTTDSDVVA
jgi:cell division protein FtsW (lipid II flippase)